MKLREQPLTIDCFIPYQTETQFTELARTFLADSSIRNVFGLSTQSREITVVNDRCTILPVKDSLFSTDAMQQIAAHTEADFCLFYMKELPVEIGFQACTRLINVAEDTQAIMIYTDHYAIKEGIRTNKPVIDYQAGSLRDDFDFGPLVLIPRQALKSYLDEPVTYYQYAGWYNLRLYLSRNGQIFHLNEYLYTEIETDLRKSGEKNFDYVNPRNRAVQLEMEKACTSHLKAIGAYLNQDEFDDLKFEDYSFPRELSVIIPVRNRVRTIEDAIKSVLSQETDFDFNLFIIDNHSTDGTTELIDQYKDNPQVIHICPDREDLGIGGCWNLAVHHQECGRFVVQLDSDDLYSSPHTLQKIRNTFYAENAAMVIGSYRMTDFALQTLPPGLIDHKEWTPANGRNNALRINGLGAPRAFFTPILRKLQIPNTSYGEDYALGLCFSRYYRIGRIYEELYLCRRWEGNSDAALSVDKVNEHNFYKDKLRTIEIAARTQLVKTWNHHATNEEIQEFIDRQLKSWPAAQESHQKLQSVITKELCSDPFGLSAQFNPARMVSTNAKIDAKSIQKRPCFLCTRNLPAEQEALQLEGRYQLLVNPFPILPNHITIPTRRHTPQHILPYFPTMCKMAWNCPDRLFFYNGPVCGASAPDHMHLQAGQRGIVPIEKDWKNYDMNCEKLYPIDSDQEEEIENLLSHNSHCGIYYLKNYACPVFIIRTCPEDQPDPLFERLYHALPNYDGEYEPRMNILCWRQSFTSGKEDEVITLVFPRKKHRPDCYYEDSDKQLLVSPGALDMGGLLITPRQTDFDKITAEQAIAILKEVTLDENEIKEVIRKIEGTSCQDSDDNRSQETPAYHHCWENKEPEVSVGIMSRQRIHFSLNTNYIAKGMLVHGEQTVECSEGGILWNGNLYRELTFIPQEENASFSLYDVTIGIKFHWERKETQIFSGTLKLMVDEEKIVAINLLPVEDYLISVISSEMSATSSLEFLKAASVISRSWLYAQMEKRAQMNNHDRGFFSFIKTETETIRWYDREDHTIFDVCADDHCQRYQGITRASNETVVEAVKATRGQILMYEDEICDARFSKCCGGLTEEFEYCWEDKHYPYLTALSDQPLTSSGERPSIPDLTKEDEAEKWIRSNPPAFCNTSDPTVLKQVLNDYDQETKNFYRWKVEYTQEELAELVRENLKNDYGQIIDLIPIERGKGGHLSKLKIVGTKHTMIIGKELEIRRVLSPNHLYSSAFVVDKENIQDCIPGKFILTGAGWGHGVGMCQIGAAVMGRKGYKYDEILKHYYNGVTIKKVYK